MIADVHVVTVVCDECGLVALTDSSPKIALMFNCQADAIMWCRHRGWHIDGMHALCPKCRDEVPK